jgi:hypothetical protein
MTKLKQLLVASFVLAVLSSPSIAGDGPCIVDDPTGTPLNVRSKPNGQIIGDLTVSQAQPPLAQSGLGEASACLSAFGQQRTYMLAWLRPHRS